MKRSNIAESLGWVGAGFTLVGYALLSLGIIDGTSWIYHSIFMVGAAGLAVVTYRHKAFQSFIVNIAFACLAVFAIIRISFFA